MVWGQTRAALNKEGRLAGFKEQLIPVRYRMGVADGPEQKACGLGTHRSPRFLFCAVSKDVGWRSWLRFVVHENGVPMLVLEVVVKVRVMQI